MTSNLHSTTITVMRHNEPCTVTVEADVYGDIVCVQHTTVDGKPFLLDDNELGAARFLVLDKVCPKQGHDKRAANLLRIAREWPYYF